MYSTYICINVMHVYFMMMEPIQISQRFIYLALVGRIRLAGAFSLYYVLLGCDGQRSGIHRSCSYKPCLCRLLQAVLMWGHVEFPDGALVTIVTGISPHTAHKK